MKITCKNCGKDNSKHGTAMTKAGFNVWQIACTDCGQNTLAESEASILGKLAKGKPKKFSKEEIKKRTERLRKFSRHNKSVVK